ncbi:unnamed protein product [Rhizoctonia solani]|uniref:Uncharacterized protein n=1 Tax=Rhizoctonia solani TaxID=456999 RepID=A0A8H3E1A6_9AGAM|nr:unnamed protein product [Rhizoctonia solani]
MGRKTQAVVQAPVGSSWACTGGADSGHTYALSGNLLNHRPRARGYPCATPNTVYPFESTTKGYSYPHHIPVEETAPKGPRLHAQSLDLHHELTPKVHTSSYSCVTALPTDEHTDEHRDSTSAEVKTLIKTDLKSDQETNQEELNGDIPCVKVLLYGDDCDYFAAADLKRLKAACLKDVPGVHPNNIRVCSKPGRVGNEFDWFFDPHDIAPGGLLILCVTGHGIRTAHGVDIRTGKFGQKLMDTLDLHTAINKIQVPCTLEVVLGTCNSEAVISGLDRLLVMEVSELPQEASVVPPPSSVLFKSLIPEGSVPKLETKATVIVWAAAVDGGPAYEEMNLPRRNGKNDVMIGAICRALTSQAIPRKTLFEKICKAVVKHNTERDKVHFNKTKVEQDNAWAVGKYRGPQLACLLGSSGNRESILNGLAFRALKLN